MEQCHSSKSKNEKKTIKTDHNDKNCPKIKYHK